MNLSRPFLRMREAPDPTPANRIQAANDQHPATAENQTSRKPNNRDGHETSCIENRPATFNPAPKRSFQKLP
jgi:hypothetical protein